MARPSKLTPEVQERLLRAISAGSYLEGACRYADIDYATFRRWIIRGSKETSGPYREFRDALTRAEAEAQVEALEQWKQARPADWRAILAFLERRYPEEWGKKDRIEVEHVIRERSRKLAEELGLDPDEVVASAERHLASLH